MAGRSLALDPDSTHFLTLFGLADEGPTPVTTTLLEAHWDGSGTLVSSDGASERYYGFRLAEVVHWMVLVAEEHGGQLEVAYDDVGGYRAITVLDFQPLPLPPGP